MNKRIFLILLLFCGNQFLIVNSEIAETYELKLDNNDPDVQKFANDAWFKIEETQYYNLKSVEVQKAQVSVVGKEKRYTILVKYKTIKTYRPADEPHDYSCYVLVRANESDPIFVGCYLKDVGSKANTYNVRN